MVHLHCRPNTVDARERQKFHNDHAPGTAGVSRQRKARPFFGSRLTFVMRRTYVAGWSAIATPKTPAPCSA
jgi:hypothetical protein